MKSETFTAKEGYLLNISLNEWLTKNPKITHVSSSLTYDPINCWLVYVFLYIEHRENPQMPG